MTQIPFSVETQHFLLLRVLLVLLSPDLGSESLPDPAVFRPPRSSHSDVPFFPFSLFPVAVAFKFSPVPEQTELRYHTNSINQVRKWGETTQH